MIISPQVVQELQATFNTDFQKAFAARKTLWEKKAYRSPSNSYKTVYSWIAEQPEMRKWVGSRYLNNMVTRALELKNEDWEYSFEVDKRDIDYDNLGAYADRGLVAGDVAKRWYDKIVTDAMLANPICWDGQNFYDTDHPVNFDDPGAGVYANAFTAKPLTATNVWELYATMNSFKGENGVPLEVQPGILEVPPQLGKLAWEAVTAPINTGIVRNQANSDNVAAAGVTNVLAGLLEVVINPRLSGDANTYYIHSVDRIKPFVLQVFRDPTELVQIVDPSAPDVFYRKKFVFGCEAVGAAAGTLPFLSIRASQV